MLSTRSASRQTGVRRDRRLQDRLWQAERDGFRSEAKDDGMDMEAKWVIAVTSTRSGFFFEHDSIAI